jgi:hypothetical protein
MPAVAPPIHVGTRRPTNLPFVLYSNLLGEDKGAFAIGGACFILTAGATLLVGDAVFMSAAFTVNKGTAAGNRVLAVGIVAGGVPRTQESATLEVIERLNDVGLQAGILNDPVVVMCNGFCYAVADGVIAVGAKITLSTGTAGQVTAAPSAAVADAEGVIGYAVDAAGAAGDKIRVKVTL